MPIIISSQRRSTSGALRRGLRPVFFREFERLQEQLPLVRTELLLAEFFLDVFFFSARRTVGSILRSDEDLDSALLCVLLLNKLLDKLAVLVGIGVPEEIMHFQGGWRSTDDVEQEPGA